MLNAARLDADQAMLLVIDVQTKLLTSIDGNQELLTAIRQILRAAKLFELPVLATEQYPQGIGSTEDVVAGLLKENQAPVLEKSTFSACGDESVRQALRRIDRPQVVVCGIEAHICVQQTTLDLISLGHSVYVCADAVGSRRPLDRDTAMQRLSQAGAVITTVESLLFELSLDCKAPRFKAVLELVKAEHRGQA